MPNTIGRRNCTARHIPSDTVCPPARSLSAAGFPTVCIPACQSRHCFMATSSRTPLIICLPIYWPSTTAALLPFMNQSTNCLSRGSRSMNLSTPFSPSPSRLPPEESRHLMSERVQAAQPPIFHGMTGKKTRSVDQSRMVADKTISILGKSHKSVT